MIMLSSLAALALGAAPVQAQSQAQTRSVTDPAKAEVVLPAPPAAPVKPAWLPKPKPWLVPDPAKPETKLPAIKL